jgi:hypothetical protein
MPAVDLKIINAALTRTGNEPVTSLSEDSIRARIADANYEDLIKTALSEYPWKRATKTASLNRLDDGDAIEPWTGAYQLPTDFVDIRTVRVSGLSINYEVIGRTIHCDAGEDDDVVLHYVWRVPEDWFPPWFKEGVIRRLEAVFLRAIGERYVQAEARDEAAKEQFAAARGRDAQGQPAREPERHPTLEARRA